MIDHDWAVGAVLDRVDALRHRERREVLPVERSGNNRLDRIRGCSRAARRKECAGATSLGLAARQSNRPIRQAEEPIVRKFMNFLIPTLAVSMLLTACGSSSSSSKSSAETSSQPASSQSSVSSALVKTASNSTVGGMILVNAQGMTLYHLSGEQNGKFICTSSACVGVWHPLTLAAGSAPTGVASLATVKRPDGSEQVTYKGTPLYTFAQDTTEGDVKGQGIKDVGTWSAVTVTSPSASAPATTSSTPSSSGGKSYAY
jgi:predicted lipoprotein with Yx(FWY)xxD motif